MHATRALFLNFFIIFFIFFFSFYTRAQVLKADFNALASKNFIAGTLPYLGYDAFDDKSG